MPMMLSSNVVDGLLSLSHIHVLSAATRPHTNIAVVVAVVVSVDAVVVVVVVSVVVVVMLNTRRLIGRLQRTNQLET